MIRVASDYMYSISDDMVMFFMLCRMHVCAHFMHAVYPLYMIVCCIILCYVLYGSKLNKE